MSKLGPCPLCGGEAIREEINTMAPEIAQCEHDGCEMANWMAVETWQKLSALAAREKRMREALERVAILNSQAAQLLELIGQGGEPAKGYRDIARICEEALK